MGQGGGEETRFRARYSRGVRTSIRNNAPAYGYSVMITSTFGVVTVEVGSPAVTEVFLFLLGAVAAVLIVEAAVSRGFRERLRGEPAEVVALGSAVGIASVGGAVGLAALAASVIGGRAAWPVGSALATAFFLLVAGLELALAERAAPEDRSA